MARPTVNPNGHQPTPAPPGPGQVQSARASTLAGFLKRRSLLIVATAIVAAAVAWGISSSQETRYESTAQLLFRPLGPEYQILGLRYSPSGDDQELQAAADLAIVSSRDLAERVARRARPRRDPGDVAAAISVVREGSSRILAVTASTSDPRDAARLVGDYVRVVKEVLREGDRNRARAARRLLVRDLAALTSERRKSEEGADLRNQIQELRALEQLGSGSPQVLERARPAATPAAPRTRRDIALGALFGLLLGGAIAAMREQSDRRLRGRDQLAGAFALPVLAEIPWSRSLTRRQSFSEPSGAVNDGFGLLQAKLRYELDREPVGTILVTSAAQGEGKSTVAWYLARAAASAGMQTLLIEANLRRPSFAERGGLDEAPGFADVLRGPLSLSETVQAVTLGASSAPAGSSERQLDVLVAGRLSIDPSDLFQSARLPTLLDEAGQHYDLVVIDVPALPAVADGIPLAQMADGVLVVARVSGATDERATQLREQLDELQARVLGVVANGVSPAQAMTAGHARRPARV